MTPRRLGWAAALAALTEPAAAWAQAASDAPMTVMEPVFVTDPGGRPLVDTAAAVALIPGEDVEAQAAIRIGEVLAAAPGVFFSGLNGPREIAQIRQPLAFDNRTLFLEDGVPLQSAVFFDQSLLGSSSVALASPGGLEVLRGPGTALYGSDALSGVVHARSKDPAYDLEGGLRLRGGEFGLFDAQGELAGPIGETQAFRVTLAAAGEDGFREETAFHRVQGIARHELQLDRFAAKTGVYFTSYETESATAIPFADFEAGSNASGLNPAVDPEEAVEEGEYLRVQSALSFQATDQLTLEATPYYRRQELGATLTFQPATTPREEALVTTVGLLPRARFEQENAVTTLGVDLEFTDLDLLLFQSRPDAVVFGSLFTQGPQFDYAVDFRAISPYLQHERAFGDVTLTLGLRYDDLRYDFDNSLPEISGDARLQVEDRVDVFDAFSPKAALLWDVDGTHSLFARYARGFRVPRASELYELEEGQAEFTLEPERLDSGELGWRGAWDRVAAEIVGYWQVSRDGVITDVQTAAGPISVNAGSSRFAGVEASLSADLGHGVEAEAVFAFQDFRFRQRAADGPDPFDGNRIAEAPRTLGNLILRWTPDFFEDATGTLRLRHIGAWPLNDANTLFTDDEFILTLQGEWRVTDAVTAELRLENVTDEIYAVFADAPVFAPAGRARIGQPRTLSGGVRVAF
ncbi:MAG: TonB-dependent receptor [Pseudomonadota bacterium]